MVNHTAVALALSIRGLSKVYKNHIQALSDLTLDVEQGDFFALLGPNGAGKSTVIGIITSLINKTDGQVQVFGHDIDVDFAAVKTCIGVVPQEYNFNQFEPVVEILINQAGYYGLPRALATGRAEKYLRRLGLWDRRHDMARSLSGGMKRRLMIARALVHEPGLLILDEPTAGVDIEVRRSMWEFLREINEQGTTIILTTHYLEEAESLCRNIAIIDHGHLIENTSMQKLLGKLKVESLLLDLVAALDEAPVLSGYRARLVNPTTLEIEHDREQSLNGLFQQLSERGIEIGSMRNKTNRLEELFLSLVNRSDERVA